MNTKQHRETPPLRAERGRVETGAAVQLANLGDSQLALPPAGAGRS